MSPCRLSRNATECVDHAEINLYAVSESINQSIDRLIDRKKYPTMLYGYLDNWLFCTLKITCLTSQLCALRFYQVFFSRLMRNGQKDLTHTKKKQLDNK